MVYRVMDGLSIESTRPKRSRLVLLLFVNSLNFTDSLEYPYQSSASV